MSSEEKKALIEALLFIENEPVEYKVLSKHAGVSKEELTNIVHELSEEYEIRKSGLQIIEVAEGYQMMAHTRFSLVLSKIYGVKNKSRLSPSLLEVLAIIAYKQPCTKSEIEAIRGVACDRAAKQLLEKDLIKISGRRESPGKPLEFMTTRNFLKIFSLKSVKELPKLREIKEMEFVLKEEE